MPEQLILPIMLPFISSIIYSGLTAVTTILLNLIFNRDDYNFLKMFNRILAVLILVPICIVTIMMTRSISMIYGSFETIAWVTGSILMLITTFILIKYPPPYS